MEKIDFVWSERDNRCAVLKILTQPGNKMTNADISRAVGVPKQTVSDIKKSWLECQDIEEVLERKPKDQDDARKTRTKEWIKRLQDLIDIDPTRPTSYLATEMGCGMTCIKAAIKEVLQASNLPIIVSEADRQKNS